LLSYLSKESSHILNRGQPLLINEIKIVLLSNKIGMENVMRKLVEGKWIHSNELIWMRFQWYFGNWHYCKVMMWYLYYLLIQTREVLEAGSYMVGRNCLDRGAGRCLAPCLFNPCKLIDNSEFVVLLLR
jgi:hypothetical protein